MARIPLYREARPLPAVHALRQRPLLAATLGGMAAIVVTGTALGRGFGVGVVPPVVSEALVAASPSTLVPNLLRSIPGLGAPIAPEPAVGVSPAITEELIGPVFVPPDADAPGAEGQGIIPAIGGVALSIVPADAPLVFDEGAAVAEMDEAFEDACGWDDGACFALGYEDAEDEGQVTAAGTDGAAGLVTMPTVSRAAPQGQPVIQNFPSPPQRSAPAAPAPPLSSGAAQPSSAATQPSSAAAQPSRAAVQTEDPPSAPATTLRRRNRGNGDDDSSQSGAGGGSATVPAAVAPQSVHREPQPVQAQPQQPATRAGNRSRNGNDDNGDRPRASQPSQPQVQRGSSPPAQPATVSQPARGHDASTAPVAQPQPVTRSVDQGNSARGSSNGNGNGRGGDARHGR